MGVRREGDEEVADDEQQTEDEQHEEHEGEESEGTEGEQGDGEGGESEDEVVVQIGDEEPPASEEKQDAPAWVKDLRKRQRELAKENAELKAKLTTGQPSVDAKPTLPAKPKLADFDYDEEKFDQARDAWDAKKREVDSWEANQAERQRQSQEAVRKVHEGYAASKAALKVKDFQDAEDETLAQFSEVQQSIVIAGATNPAAMVYALGKNPAKLRELASIKDPVKFAFAVSKLEDQVKVTTRKGTKPAPETTVRGGGSAPASTATLDRLRAEADRTGDRTKVAAYLRQNPGKGK